MAKFGVTEVLSYTGGMIVFSGIVVLVMQHWSTIGFGSQMLVTLGLGVVTYWIGILCSKDEFTKAASSACYLISVLVLPVGIWVVIDHYLKWHIYNYESLSVISGILLALCLVSYFFLRNHIFTLFSILYGNLFFYYLVCFMFQGSAYFDSWIFLKYYTLVFGIVYMLLGHVFSKRWPDLLIDFLYNSGVITFLGAALVLELNSTIFWDLMYPVLIFGTLFLGVYIKRKALLLWSALFLFAYILNMTLKHFMHSLGWPLALVIAGLAMIGIGYLFLVLKKKYFS